MANNTNQEYFWNFTEKSAHSMKNIKYVCNIEERIKRPNTLPRNNGEMEFGVQSAATGHVINCVEIS